MWLWSILVIIKKKSPHNEKIKIKYEIEKKII